MKLNTLTDLYVDLFNKLWIKGKNLKAENPRSA
jgi:hypothetical protein